MPRPGTILIQPAAEPTEQPFLLRNPGDPAETLVAAPVPRIPRGADPFEVRLSGKLLRAQLRGTLPARHR